MSKHFTLSKGGLFSYVGEFRIPVNLVPVVDYTNWTITGRIEAKDGDTLRPEAFVVEWINITEGLFRFRIPVDQHGNFKAGIEYTMYIVLTTPAGEPLPPVTFTLSAKEN